MFAGQVAELEGHRHAIPPVMPAHSASLGTGFPSFRLDALNVANEAESNFSVGR